MKQLVVLILAFLPIFCLAQKIEVRVDDFTGEKIATTAWEKIYSGGMTGKDQTRIRFRHESGKDFMELRIFTDCVTSCDKEKEILLKTNNGVIKLYNLEYTLSKPGDWNPSGINNKLGIYLRCSGSDLKKLSDDTVTKMRITLSDGYRDLDLKDKDSAKLLQLYNSFKEHNKQ